MSSKDGEGPSRQQPASGPSRRDASRPSQPASGRRALTPEGIACVDLLRRHLVGATGGAHTEIVRKPSERSRGKEEMAVNRREWRDRPRAVTVAVAIAQDTKRKRPSFHLLVLHPYHTIATTLPVGRGGQLDPSKLLAQQLQHLPGQLSSIICERSSSKTTLFSCPFFHLLR